MPSTGNPRISEPSTVCFKAVLAVSCDITSPESIEELQQRVASQFTDLRVVVCNAGVPRSTHWGRVMLMCWDRWIYTRCMIDTTTTRMMMMMMMVIANLRSLFFYICSINIKQRSHHLANYKTVWWMLLRDQARLASPLFAWGLKLQCWFICSCSQGKNADMEGLPPKKLFTLPKTNILPENGWLDYYYWHGLFLKRYVSLSLTFPAISSGWPDQGVYDGWFFVALPGWLCFPDECELFGSCLYRSRISATTLGTGEPRVGGDPHGVLDDQVWTVIILFFVVSFAYFCITFHCIAYTPRPTICI